MDERMSIDNFSTADKLQFQKVCRNLLKTTFIVRDKDDDQRKYFNFVRRYKYLFQQYFEMMGYDVMCYDEYGIVQLVNTIRTSDDTDTRTSISQLNKRKLKLQDAIVLLALWSKYRDIVTSGNLSKAIIITIADLNKQLDKMGLLNKPSTKTAMGDILKIFETYNLIEVMGDVGSSDCKIRLYSSIQFIISELDFCSFLKAFERKNSSKSVISLFDGEGDVGDAETVQ